VQLTRCSAWTWVAGKEAAEKLDANDGDAEASPAAVEDPDGEKGDDAANATSSAEGGDEQGGEESKEEKKKRKKDKQDKKDKKDKKKNKKKKSKDGESLVSAEDLKKAFGGISDTFHLPLLLNQAQGAGSSFMYSPRAFRHPVSRVVSVVS